MAGLALREGHAAHERPARALIYSRIRENQLNPRESDLTRGERQQAVIQAMLREADEPRRLVQLPFIGDDMLKPLATDLSAGQMMQLGWRQEREPARRSTAGSAGRPRIRRRGTSAGRGEPAVIQMFTGDSAPQPPLPGSGVRPGLSVGSVADSAALAWRPCRCLLAFSSLLAAVAGPDSLACRRPCGLREPRP